MTIATLVYTAVGGIFAAIGMKSVGRQTLGIVEEEMARQDLYFHRNIGVALLAIFIALAWPICALWLLFLTAQEAQKTP